MKENKIALYGNKEIIIGNLPCPDGSQKIEILDNSYKVETINIPSYDSGAIVGKYNDKIVALYSDPDSAAKGRINMIKDDNKDITPINLPVNDSDAFMPLLLYDKNGSLNLILVKEKNGTYTLVSGDITSDKVAWKEIGSGEGSLIADAGTDVALLDNTFYFTQMGKVFAVDISDGGIKKFLAANEAIDKVKDVVINESESGVLPELGVYNGTLIVKVGSGKESWIWAFSGDKNVGEIHIKNDVRNAEISKEGNVQSVKLPDNYTGMLLPHQGYFLYK